MKRILILELVLILYTKVFALTIPFDQTITIREILTEKNYISGQTLTFRDTVPPEILRNIENADVITTKGGCSDVCLNVFIKWCNKFSDGIREYVLIGPIRTEDNGWQVLFEKDRVHREYRYSGTNISFESIMQEISINEYLRQNKVLLLYDSYISHNQLYNLFYAVLPYDGKMFMINFNLCFLNTLRSELLQEKGYRDIGRELGKKIQERPAFFADCHGYIQDSFYEYFSWKFWNINVDIKECVLPLETVSISVYDLLEKYKLFKF